MINLIREKINLLKDKNLRIKYYLDDLIESLAPSLDDDEESLDQEECSSHQRANLSECVSSSCSLHNINKAENYAIPDSNIISSNFINNNFTDNPDINGNININSNVNDSISNKVGPNWEYNYWDFGPLSD